MQNEHEAGNSFYDWDTQMIMNDKRLQTIEEVKEFLAGSGVLDFSGISLKERYRWMETVPVRFKYYQMKRATC